MLFYGNGVFSVYPIAETQDLENLFRRQHFNQRRGLIPYRGPCDFQGASHRVRAAFMHVDQAGEWPVDIYFPIPAEDPPQP